MRPIDADALIDEARKDGAYGYVDIYQIIDAPTLDVAPVVHGEWIDAVIPNDNGGLPVIVCDKCNTFYPLQFGDAHRYCPNCGAKMDGKEHVTRRWEEQTDADN